MDVAAIDDQDVVLGFVRRGFAGGNLAEKRPWVESYLRR
jgi:hypothetical protein